MELKDFVSESLAQIIEGIKTAQGKTARMGATINPKGLKAGTEAYAKAQFNKETGVLAQMVAFDIAVTATKGKSTKGGIGVFMGAVGVGTQGRSQREQSMVSRITFEIPVLFPEKS